MFELENICFKAHSWQRNLHVYPEHMHDFVRRATKTDSSSIIGPRYFGHVLSCKKEGDLIVMERLIRFS
jgi:hypothetical protein